MILSAQSIRKRQIVWPFHERSITSGMSYGLSSCGYDIRLDRDMWLWPFWGRLGASIEHFKMPYDVCAEVKDKSTNARRFITVQNTIIEPGWRGYLTLEITRHLPWPVRLKKGMPIAQVVFKTLDYSTEQPYSGKYQDQAAGPQEARYESQMERYTRPV